MSPSTTNATSLAAYGCVRGPTCRALYVTIVGPFFLTILLLSMSGVTLQERPNPKKRYEAGTNWEAYFRYLHKSSILIWFPPQLYAPMPTTLKCAMFLAFPIYVLDPVKYADQSKLLGRAQQKRLRDEGGSNRASRNQRPCANPCDLEDGLSFKLWAGTFSFYRGVLEGQYR